MSIHLDASEKDERLPEIGEGKQCGRKDCPAPDFGTAGYGLAGGGMGTYEICGVCDRVVTKTLDQDEAA